MFRHLLKLAQRQKIPTIQFFDKAEDGSNKMQHGTRTEES